MGVVCTMCDKLHTPIKAVHVWCDPPSSFSQGVDFKQCDLSPPPHHILPPPFSALLPLLLPLPNKAVHPKHVCADDLLPLK